MAAQSGAAVEGHRIVKSAAAFRTISEVAETLDIPQHVLRFWESKFSQIKPLKRGGGRRYYRPEDIDLLRGIRDLLYTDGYTIRGVQKLLREGGVKALGGTLKRPSGAAKTTGPGRKSQGGLTAKQRKALKTAHDDLVNLRDALLAEVD